MDPTFKITTELTFSTKEVAEAEFNTKESHLVGAAPKTFVIMMEGWEGMLARTTFRGENSLPYLDRLALYLI